MRARCEQWVIGRGEVTAACTPPPAPHGAAGATRARRRLRRKDCRAETHLHLNSGAPPDSSIKHEKPGGGVEGGGVSTSQKPKEFIAFLTCRRQGLCAGHV